MFTYVDRVPREGKSSQKSASCVRIGSPVHAEIQPCHVSIDISEPFVVVKGHASLTDLPEPACLSGSVVQIVPRSYLQCAPDTHPRSVFQGPSPLSQF